MNLDIYKNQIEELILLHKYIKRKVILRIIIIAILVLISFIFAAIFSENDEMAVSVVIVALVTWSLAIFLGFNISKLTTTFQNGNYTELVKNILTNEIDSTVDIISDKKMNKELFVSNSNFITKSYSPYFNTSLKIDDLYYQYLSVTFSKNVTYSGYAINIPLEIEGDFKIVDKELSSYMINYKKDKEFSSKKSFIYYKKNKDDKVVEYFDKVIDYVNELFGVEVPVGLCIYNKHLTILLGSNFSKIRKSFGFSFKLNEQIIKDYIEQILTDLKNTKLVKEKILESANSYESI